MTHDLEGADLSRAVVFVERGLMRKPNSRQWAMTYGLVGDEPSRLFWRAQAKRHAEAEGKRAKFVLALAEARGAQPKERP